jgi:hypothetical protein
MRRASRGHQGLTDARLLTASADPPRGGPASATRRSSGRPRVRQWLDEDRAGQRVLRRITEASAEWLRLGRDEGLLYRGARLAEAVEWRETNEALLNDDERAFLDASVALATRERTAKERARRRVTIAAGALAAVFLVLAGLAGLVAERGSGAGRGRAAAGRGGRARRSRPASAGGRGGARQAWPRRRRFGAGGRVPSLGCGLRDLAAPGTGGRASPTAPRCGPCCSIADRGPWWFRGPQDRQARGLTCGRCRPGGWMDVAGSSAWRRWTTPTPPAGGALNNARKGLGVAFHRWRLVAASAGQEVGCGTWRPATRWQTTVPGSQRGAPRVRGGREPVLAAA